MIEKELGIYIHIPFCKKKCKYCDFISYCDKQNEINDYIQSLKNEIRNWKNKLKNKINFNEQYKITSVYIGGGTPSYINEEKIREIINEINNIIQEINKTKEKIEITIEVNPGTVNIDKIKMYKKIGINRISIGLQSTENVLLKNIGRIHTWEDFLNTYEIIKNENFNNCNIDLMIGLPGQNLNDVKKSIQKVLGLKPQHISVYSLILEENTPLFYEIENQIQKLPNEDIERKMYWYVKRTLEKNGYIQYEISNFSKKGFISKHNWNCWHQKEYIGFGIAAHSYINNKRFSNTPNMEDYIDYWYNNNLQKLNQVRKIEEVQTIEDKQKEYMLLGLRTLEGISINVFKNKFNKNPIYLFRNELNKLVKEKLILVDGNYIKLTEKGIDFANIVWEEFI